MTIEPSPIIAEHPKSIVPGVAETVATTVGNLGQTILQEQAENAAEEVGGDHQGNHRPASIDAQRASPPVSLNAAVNDRVEVETDNHGIVIETIGETILVRSEREVPSSGDGRVDGQGDDRGHPFGRTMVVIVQQLIGHDQLVKFEAGGAKAFDRHDPDDIAIY